MSLNANDLQKAEQLEEAGKYKEANTLYKRLLKTDSITNRQLEFIRKKVEKSDDEETNLTIKQVLTSSFDMHAYKDNYFLPLS